MAEKSALGAAADADVGNSRVERRAAATIRYNPIVSLAAGPRFGDATSTDLEASISQTFELGGKRRKRTAAAAARLRKCPCGGASRRYIANHNHEAQVGAKTSKNLIDSKHLEDCQTSVLYSIMAVFVSRRTLPGHQSQIAEETMAYRNKTYVAFDADSDIHYYRLMKAWKQVGGIEFDFHDAHDLNNLWQNSSEATIKQKLRERLKNAKVFVLLLGEHTKHLYKTFVGRLNWPSEWVCRLSSSTSTRSERSITTDSRRSFGASFL